MAFSFCGGSRCLATACTLPGPRALRSSSSILTSIAEGIEGIYLCELALLYRPWSSLSWETCEPELFRLRNCCRLLFGNSMRLRSFGSDLIALTWCA